MRAHHPDEIYLSMMSDLEFNNWQCQKVYQWVEKHDWKVVRVPDGTGTRFHQFALMKDWPSLDPNNVIDPSEVMGETITVELERMAFQRLFYVEHNALEKAKRAIGRFGYEHGIQLYGSWRPGDTGWCRRELKRRDYTNRKLKRMRLSRLRAMAQRKKLFGIFAYATCLIALEPKTKHICLGKSTPPSFWGLVAVDKIRKLEAA